MNWYQGNSEIQTPNLKPAESTDPAAAVQAFSHTDNSLYCTLRWIAEVIFFNVATVKKHPQ